MYCIIKARLLDKEVTTASGVKVPIFGLARMNITPKKKGLGRLSLELFKKLGEQKGKYAIIGFVNNDSIGFYLNCGWLICGEFEGVKAVSSVPLQIIFEEKW